VLLALARVVCLLARVLCVCTCRVIDCHAKSSLGFRVIGFRLWALGFRFEGLVVRVLSHQEQFEVLGF
jgi:hypothetical protein